MLRLPILVLIFDLCTAAVLLAAEEPEALVTDRPDFTESALTVPAGSVQFEFGYTFSRVGEEEGHSLGELLVRAALHRRVELRVGLNSFAWVKTTGEDFSGLEDSSLGVKLKLLDAAEEPGFGRPDMALIAGTTLPTGGEGLGAGDPQPEAKLCLGWDLSERLALSSNLGYARLEEDGRHFCEASGSVSLGVALADSLGGYVEYYGFLHCDDEVPDAGYFDGGLTYGLTDNLQFDLRGGLGHSGPAPDYFIGAGAAWRWFPRR